MLRSVALMLAHGLERPAEARALDEAVDRALETTPTPDLGGDATTERFTDAVLAAVVA
jgi:3-isopropylmalate dehydrogenase